MSSLFKSKRSRTGGVAGGALSSTGSSETISSSSGRNSSLGSNRGGEVSDLGQMSVPYDRLGPGGKVNEKRYVPKGTRTKAEVASQLS